MIGFPPLVGDALKVYLRGFFKGYLGDAEHSAVLDEGPGGELQVHYVQGIEDGRSAVDEGVDIGRECIDTRIDTPLFGHILEGVDALVEVAGIVKALRSLATAAPHAGALAVEVPLLILTASIALSKDFRTLEELGPPRDLTEFQELLARVSDPVSMELFVGGGIKPDEEGCQLKLTPIFQSAAKARTAAKAMGRPNYVIGAIRTDASGSFRIIEEG